METGTSSLEGEAKRPRHLGVGVRLIALTLILNSTLFFRGCAFDETLLTVGFPMPALVFVHDDNRVSLNKNSVDGAALRRLALNIVIGCVLGLAAWFVARPIFLSRALAFGLIFSYAAFNLLIVAPQLWAKTVFHLQVAIFDWLFEDERRMGFMDTATRVYFVLHVLVCALIAELSRRGWRRHVATGENWWQFGLTGIFVIMTLACVLVALGLQIFVQR